MDFAAGADAGASDATNTCHDENWLSGGEECPAFRMRQDEILRKMKKSRLDSVFGITKGTKYTKNVDFQANDPVKLLINSSNFITGLFQVAANAGVSGEMSGSGGEKVHGLG